MGMPEDCKTCKCICNFRVTNNCETGQWHHLWYAISSACKCNCLRFMNCSLFLSLRLSPPISSQTFSSLLPPQTHTQSLDFGVWVRVPGHGVSGPWDPVWLFPLAAQVGQLATSRVRSIPPPPGHLPLNYYFFFVQSFSVQSCSVLLLIWNCK